MVQVRINRPGEEKESQKSEEKKPSDDVKPPLPLQPLPETREQNRRSKLWLCVPLIFLLLLSGLVFAVFFITHHHHDTPPPIRIIAGRRSNGNLFIFTQRPKWRTPVRPIRNYGIWPRK